MRATGSGADIRDGWHSGVVTDGRDQGNDLVAALVSTQGARLVRLAHLLGAEHPEATVADALATTLLHKPPRGDAHDELVAAAEIVGERGRPPVRGTARLQGWLDRTELDSYAVDVGALRTATAQRLAAQRRRRRTIRLRTAAGAAAAVVVAVTAGALWPGDDQAPAGWPVPGSGILYPNDPLLNGGDPDPDDRPRLPEPGAVQLPARQHSASNLPVGQVVLNGRSIAIMPTTMAGSPAHVLGVGCTARGGVPAMCVLALPTTASLADIGIDALVLSSPPTDVVDSVRGPSVLRAPVIDGLTGQTLTIEFTSSDVDALLVTYTDGSQVLANRYRVPNRPGTLFAALNRDVMPAEVSYLAADGTTLARIALYTATP